MTNSNFNITENYQEWISIYFVKNENEYRCNICEENIKCDEKSPELLKHIKCMHREVYDLHKSNPESTVGFQIEFLQFNMLKDDDGKSQPVILEEVCESDEIVKCEEKTDKDLISNMQYVLVPRKKKLKKSYGE